MTCQGRNGAPRSPQLSMSIGSVLGNKRIQSELRKDGQAEPRWSYSKELVPPCYHRERSTMNSMRPSQSSKDQEMDLLRAQVLASQRKARHHEGNRDHRETSPNEGDSHKRENTLGCPQQHQERLVSPPRRYW